MVKLSEMKKKVINIRNGAGGYIYDFEIDLKMVKYYFSASWTRKSFSIFGKNNNYLIDWKI